MTEPRLFYLAPVRMPTEKAHGLQIVQMCEALAQVGYDVTLIVPRRLNTPELHNVRDIWAHYGVARNFALVRLPCLDLFRFFPAHPISQLTVLATYLLALLVWMFGRRVDVLYTRDLLTAFVLRVLRPRTPLVYEVHRLSGSRWGRKMQGFVMRRARVVTVTRYMAEQARARGAQRVIAEHDGYRAARFADMSPKAEARAALGISADAFVVGYVGRLHTMGLSKGVDTLIDGIAEATRDGAAIDLLLVGGPPEGVALARAQWQAHGLPAERLHTVGTVASADVPRYLAALDVGAMLLPWTEHFAYYASALKLFEYMAAGCAVLASDLPSTAEVVRNGETALLVPPGDVAATAAALRRLHDDPALRQRLAERARAAAPRYTWEARARRIRQFIEEQT